MANGRHCGMGVCAKCGKEFEKTSNGAKYCSRECADAANLESRREKRRKKSAILLAPRKCKQCGKTFKPHKVKQKFCCGHCAVKAKRAEEMAARTVEKTCLQCGAKFTTSRGDRMFCSSACCKKHAAGEKYKLEHDGRLPGRPGRPKKDKGASDGNGKNGSSRKSGMPSTPITEEQRRQVLIDLGAPSSERWKRSSKWTPQMHAYARKVWMEKSDWCSSFNTNAM